MATMSLSAFSAVLNLLFMDSTVDQFRRDSFLLNVLEAKPDTNAVCTWSVKMDARSAGGAYAEGADMGDSDFDSHVKVPATLNWAGYHAGSKISGRAMRVSAANGAASVNGNVFREDISDAIDKVAMDLSADLYAGNPAASPVELAGAALAIDDNTGVSFAGISPGTYGDWVATEDTTTAAALTKQVIREKLLTPVKQASGYRPEFVTVPDDLWDQVMALADEGAHDVKEIRINGQMVDVVAITGVTAVFIDGVPFVNDRHCTSGTMYAWNTRFVHLRYIPATAPSALNPAQLQEKIKDLTGKDVPIDEIEQRLRTARRRLMPEIDILAKDGDNHKAEVRIGEVQVRWEKRNAFGKLTVT